MKKIFLFLLPAFFYLPALAQTLVFHENMENIDSLTSSGSPGWLANTNLQTSGLQSDSSSVVAGGTSLLETLPINLTGNTFVVLNFNHICKTSFFDQAIVEVFDGNSWVQLTAQNMMPGQPDSAIFDGLQNNFSEAIYMDWLTGQIVSPDNSWWKTESFDISPIAANVPNAKIRWKLADQNLPGGDSRAGWFIDDITVIAAPCELFPPSLTQLAPVIQNSVLNLGPYTLNINLSDASGIDTPSVIVVYTINGNSPDTATMTNTTGNIFSGIIPAVADSDTVCYYFYARDNSPCHNPVQYPASGCISFVAHSGLVISFCDDFNLNNYWTATTVSGSPWQYGTPAVSPVSAHSPPNCWEVALGAQYAGNTNSYLVSPDISFLNVLNADVDFWFYSDCENTWDGARLEYSTDLGNTWTVLGNTGTGINWYNNASLLSSSLPGWTGNFTWTNAKHNLSVLNNIPLVRFRFVFTSDPSVQLNGFAIDDFCIIQPIQYDAGVVSVLNPGSAMLAGICQDVIVSVHNFGTQPISSFNISYSVNGTVYGPYMINSTILPGNSLIDTLPCFSIPIGLYSLCSWTSLGNDGNHVNDTTCGNLTGVGSYYITDSISFCDSFDGINYGWLSQLLPGGSSTSNWELGTPNYGVTNSTHSPPNAWDINLNSPYTNSAHVALLSPYFIVSANANPKVSLWQNRNTEVNWDGVRIEYTSNDGAAWTNIGMLADTGGTNWYTSLPACSNLPSWEGNSSGWIYSEHRNLQILNNDTIRFRLIFCSDGSITSDGFSIDDFCFGRDTFSTTAIDENFLYAENISLGVNIPNPFIQKTSVSYSIPVNGFVELFITDLSGRKIKDIVSAMEKKGIHKIEIEPEGLKPGIYFYSMRFQNKTLTKKMVMVDW